MAIRSDTISLVRTGEGPPLLMVHGLPGTHSIWSPLQAELSRLRTLVAVDLPGFGASPAPLDERDLAVSSLARALLDLATVHGFPRFDLVAHSYGAAVAATAAVLAPDRVRSLALVAPMGYDVPPVGRLGRTRALIAFLDLLWRTAPPPLRRRAVAYGVRLNYGEAYLEHRAAQIASELDRDDAIRQIFRTIAAVDFSEYRATLEHLQNRSNVPVLIFGGGHDRVVPPAHFQHLAALLTRAERWYDEGGVHVLMWQHPHTVAERIVRFLGEVGD
jgi:pimeloyl-ACP methyl ester carboxylesterase